MFSSTLRTRDLWKALGPAMASSALASFKESPMTSSDLIIPVQTTLKQMTVRVILMKKEDLATGEAEKRLHVLSTAVRPANSIEVVLLIHDLDQAGAQGGLPAIMQLQRLILQNGFSILPIHAPSVDKIIPTLERFSTPLKAASPTLAERSPVTSQLIAHATASAPTRLLSRNQANTLSELFPSVRDLEAGTRTAEGQAKIQKYLGPSTSRDIIDFWEDEWLA